jgi:hypothetical protein
MRRLILALAAVALTTCGCCRLFCDRASYYQPVQPAVPAPPPAGP